MNGILLFAHGSRDPYWHRPMLAVAERIAQQSPDTAVRCAYLELTPPTLAEAASELIAQGVTRLTVLPLFLGMGKHAREDLPQLLHELRAAYPHIRIDCQPAVGEQSAMIELLADLALKKPNIE